jgi:hypothetical protein
MNALGGLRLGITFFDNLLSEYLRIIYPFDQDGVCQLCLLRKAAVRSQHQV